MKVKEILYPPDLIRTINPNIPPEQAVAQVRALNEIEFNPTKIPVIQARDKLLKDAGESPRDWEYYSNVFPLEGQTHEDMFEWLTEPFPRGVEFLVVPGAVSGGISVTEDRSVRAIGIVNYKFIPDHFTAFVTVRRLLPEKT